MSMRNNDLTAAEKKRKIKAANKKFIKKYKLEDNPNVKIGILSENEDIGVVEQFKTGNIAYDILTGGNFKGLVNVVYGGPGVGKSTAMRDMIAYTQKEYDAFGLYMNQEKTMDRNYWEERGVNFDQLQVAEFETVEQSLDMCNRCATGEVPVDILVIDTLQALAPEGELYKGKDTKSVSDNTMALIPRLYSQFFRMYTSLNTGLSIVLVSQIRTAGIGGGMPFDGMTGGNAIKHYCNLIVRMNKSESLTQWPYSVAALPPHSYVVTYKIDKIKGANRYKGLKLKGYFVKGQFEKRFNIIAIAKDLGLHDGKTLQYPNPEKPDEMIDYSARGLNEMINGGDKRRLPKEAVDYLETLLEPTFLEIANKDIAPDEDDEVDLTVLDD